ncbi:MAG: helix-turn-helix transcriptional regulator [Planctomycetota bacterium]
MDMSEKLKRIIGDRSANAFARSIGIGSATISRYLSGDATPTLKIALKIARSENVPLEWLADDEQDWPAPEGGGRQLKDYEDRDLMREIATRYRRAAVELRDKIRSVDPRIHKDTKARWAELLRRALDTPVDKPLDEELSKALDVAGPLSRAIFHINAFMPDKYALLLDSSGENLPGKGQPHGPLDANSLRQDYASLVEDQPAEASALLQLADFRIAHEMFPDRREEFAFYIDYLRQAYTEDGVVPSRDEMVRAWDDRPFVYPKEGKAKPRAAAKTFDPRRHPDKFKKPDDA